MATGGGSDDASAGAGDARQVVDKIPTLQQANGRNVAAKLFCQRHCLLHVGRMVQMHVLQEMQHGDCGMAGISRR